MARLFVFICIVFLSSIALGAKAINLPPCSGEGIRSTISVANNGDREMLYRVRLLKASCDGESLISEDNILSSSIPAGGNTTFVNLPQGAYSLCAEFDGKPVQAGESEVFESRVLTEGLELSNSEPITKIIIPSETAGRSGICSNKSIIGFATIETGPCVSGSFNFTLQPRNRKQNRIVGIFEEIFQDKYRIIGRHDTRTMQIRGVLRRGRKTTGKFIGVLGRKTGTGSFINKNSEGVCRASLNLNNADQ